MARIEMVKIMLRDCLFLVSFHFLTVSSRSFGDDPRVNTAGATPSKCGYDSCPKPKPGFINVHLVPHTHDDLGWLKTVDQYYLGVNETIYPACVKCILYSVIEELLKDPGRKFTWVETAFFWKWWIRQSESMKNDVRRLVAEGQLEFAGGAWSMNDEACTNYMSIIDQFTWGLRKLNDTFGSCGQPKVGWQIDPFGHSREQASLFPQLGFDAFFMARIDHQDKLHRLGNRTMEMIWQGSDDLGSSANIFTHVLFNHYVPPSGFHFDKVDAGETIFDDKNSPGYNLDRMLSKFDEWVKRQQLFYTSSNIILTMGDDFSYRHAGDWYRNMDILIRESNAQQVTKNSKVNIFYSTPSCYVKAVHEEKLSYTTKDNDFFPYADFPHSYWTGYFTSRPTLKYFERLGNNYLQVCKQLSALSDFGLKEQINLDTMRSVMGIMQHHDAITGTSQQHVAADYAKILAIGFAKCDEVANTTINKLTKLSAGEIKQNLADNLQFKSCNLLNISACDVSEQHSRFVVTVYNPQSQFISKFVRLPIKDSASYKIYDPDGKVLTTQIVPISPAVLNIPGRDSQATHELIFRADHVPPLGFKSYYVSLDASNPHKPIIEPSSDHYIGDARFGLELDETHSKIISLSIDGFDFEIQHNYFDYGGGNNKKSFSFGTGGSGAYIFRPAGKAKVINEKPQMILFKGLLVDEIHVTYSNYTSEVIRLYAGEHHIEFEWLVGPIPFTSRYNYRVNDDKEILSRFSTSIKNNATFYTDSNGRQLIKRFLNEETVEPIAGNYYPITSKIVINDTNSRLAVINDRSQGGSSLANGQIELMVHRRLMHDDTRGVAEALNEKAFGKGLVARGTHYLTVGTNDVVQARVERQLEISKMLGPWLFFTPARDMTFEDWAKNYRMQFSGLSDALPPNVQVLTLEPWKGRSLLLRLENIYQKYENSQQEETIVDLQKLFTPFSITSVKETTLGANQWVEESQRLKWTYDLNQVPEQKSKMSKTPVRSSLTRIALTPMQIRTFVIKVSFTSSQPAIRSELFEKYESSRFEQSETSRGTIVSFQDF